MITLTDVCFQYTKDNPAVLDHLSFEVRPGEAVAIVGANGSGKSTLALLIAGLQRPRSGGVLIDGEKVSEDAIRRKVGILFQNPDNQMVGVTVEKELAFGLENRAVPPKEMVRQIDEVIARFQIEHLRHRLTSELSGGEKQRVALAAVMICRPEILLLDEPDSYLDQQGRGILNEELARLRKEQPELIELRITQYLDQARSYPRLLILSKGKLVYDGPAEAALDNHDLLVASGLFLCDECTIDSPISNRLTLTSTSRIIQRLDLEQVSFSYEPARPLLQDVSASFTREDNVCVVGPSGSGKSTLALLLTSLLKPQRGSVTHYHANGELMNRPKAGCIVAVFQQPERQFFLNTVWDELAFGPHNIGVPMSHEESVGLLNLVGLEPDRFLKRDPFTLSTGEQRRLAIGVVLAMRPSFIVFDEPTGGLDPVGVLQFVALSRHLRELGIGQIIITHDGDIVRKLASRVLVMRAAEMREVTPQEFWSRADCYLLVSTPCDVDKSVRF